MLLYDAFDVGWITIMIVFKCEDHLGEILK